MFKCTIPTSCHSKFRQVVIVNSGSHSTSKIECYTIQSNFATNLFGKLGEFDVNVNVQKYVQNVVLDSFSFSCVERFKSLQN